MTEKGAEPGEQARIFTPIGCDQDGSGALQRVKEKRQRGELLIAGAQHICGADIA